MLPTVRKIRRRRHSWFVLLLPFALLLLTAPLPQPQADSGLQGIAALPTAAIALRPTAAGVFPAAAPTASAAPATAIPALPTAALAQGMAPVVWPLPALPSATPALPTPAPTAEITASPAAPLATDPPLAPLGAPGYVPIVMYHYVRSVDQASDPLGYELSIIPEHLAAQLDLIASRGYTTIRMDRLARCLAAQERCPAHAIALTFDDGYADAFAEALPALQARGMVATFYIVSDFVGQPAYMTWNQVRAMHDAGMEIGSHSVSHSDLTTLDADQLRFELVASRDRIAAEIGAPVLSFCYPSGRYNSTVMAAAAEAGYLSATTTLPDLPETDRMQLPRLRIAGGYGAAELGAMIP